MKYQLTKTEEFIQKSKNKHGDKFDYSLVDYINSQTKVKIICPNHGVFLQRPSSHVYGIGCPECSGKNKKTRESFVSKSKSVHGDKYDYDQVDYINCKTKVNITCKKHGIFSQTPDSHIQGTGCPSCGNNKPKTQEYFIKRAKNIHKNKYDYSSSVYIDSQTPVKIICPIHGEFTQLPNVHILQKCGCPICGTERRSNKNKLTKEKFIKRAVKKHGNKFDYSLVNYVDYHTPVIIIDRVFGVFKETPKNHIKNKGYGHKNNIPNKLSTEEFIKKSKEIHGNKYDYSLVDYRGTKNKVKIICPKHGVFSQQPNAHISSKCGCLSCNVNYPQAKDLWAS